VSFDDSAIRISGGNLGSTYRVSSVHFHWGGTDAKGSEHTIEDEQQAAEVSATVEVIDYKQSETFMFLGSG